MQNGSSLLPKLGIEGAGTAAKMMPAAVREGYRLRQSSHRLIDGGQHCLQHLLNT